MNTKVDLKNLATNVWIDARIDYWGEVLAAVYTPADNVYREEFVSAEILDVHTQERYVITVSDIIRAISMLATSGMNYSNSGYDRSPFGDTRSRFMLLLNSGGVDSDYDAFDADAIIQIAALGELTYS